MEIQFFNLRQTEGIIDEISPVKDLTESKINLSREFDKAKRVSLNVNKVMRICFITGLSLPEKRNLDDIKAIPMAKSANRITGSFFTLNNMTPLYSAMLKLRYSDMDIDWTNNILVSKIFAYEMLRGRDYLMDENNLNSLLFASGNGNGSGHATNDIPKLDLIIGDYGEDMPAMLPINNRSVTNSQILIAGSTGSGKSNLIAVLIQQFCSLSIESPYPVNFLLFDYKGEFSDPMNDSWLKNFDVDRSCILDPIQAPLPFTPFKDFTGKAINEINLYSTEMATALCAIDRANVSANMSNRLSEAIVEAYKKTNGAPINFELMLKEYTERLNNPDKDDSVTSVLKQLTRNNLFEKEDKVDIIKECFVVKMDAFPKDGPIAKAIVYFIISKLNNVYEQLEKQATNEEYVQIRHFTIIDEAHYMLDFDNRPLRNLIAVGRNKGLSIILATQNMSSFSEKTNKNFDYYANAQYPLIMKQQTINDQVIKDVFGVSGSDLQEIRSEIAMLQKGELIIKDNLMAAMGMGKSWKKIKVTHLI